MRFNPISRARARRQMLLNKATTLSRWLRSAANNISKYNSVRARVDADGIFIMGKQVRRRKHVVYTRIYLRFLYYADDSSRNFLNYLCLYAYKAAHAAQNHNISGSFIAETGWSRVDSDL